MHQNTAFLHVPILEQTASNYCVFTRFYHSERICPPSSRVSPVCLRQSPVGRATLGSRTLSIVPSLCHSLRWCKKNRAHPQLRTFVWCSALLFSAPCASRLQLRNERAFGKSRFYTFLSKKDIANFHITFCAVFCLFWRGQQGDYGKQKRVNGKGEE